MKALNVALILFVTLFAVVTSSQTLAQENARITTVTTGGSGCPQGSVEVQMDLDNKGFTILPSTHVAAIGPDVPRKENRKICQYAISLSLPQGWTYASVTHLQGVAHLDTGVSGIASITTYFDTARERITSLSVPEDFDHELQLSNSNSMLWSNCNESNTLNIKTELRLDSTDRNASGVMELMEHKTRIRFRPCQSMAGSYENHLYDQEGKNDWHFVQISETQSGNYVWTNRAGISWQLTETSNPNEFAIGADCPYYDFGYTIARVERHPDGRVSKIFGPFGEPYETSN